MPKGLQTRFVCRECGYESPKWLGHCPGCEAWSTLEETVTLQTSAKSGSTFHSSTISLPQNWIGATSPAKLSDIPSTGREQRVKSGIDELDRVLGGGIVAGALILIGGDPGIGKSTLLTQAAGSLAKRGGKVLYVSGEESITQIKLRADRLGVTGEDLFLYNETNISLIGSRIVSEQAAFVIIDSIQTMIHPELDSSPGSVSQVRGCAAALAQIAKSEGIAVFLVGHVTKEGALAGPKVLEHMVDTVLTFEGDRHYLYRVLRAAKNRFGSTDELGLFEMHEEGLIEISNPSEILLSERTSGVAGSAITASVEGTRPLLIEVQALVSPSYLANPRRTVSGADTNRVNLILAVLEKRIGLRLVNQDVFINIAGGIRIDEPAADIAIAAAVASNFHEKPLDSATVLIGEVGLAGEMRAVGQMEKRLREASRMGFTRAVISAKNKAGIRGSVGLEVIGVESASQAINLALSR